MRRLPACFVFVLLTLSISAFAQVSAGPPLLHFQGRLAKPDGTPVPDGTYAIKFSLFTAAGGTQKWTETDTVAVHNGVFAALLGRTNALSDALFAGNLWLEIKVGTDPALTPRQPLLTVAYAFKADTIPDASIGTTQLKDGAVTSAKLASGVLNLSVWLLGGNSGTNPATQYIGTKDNRPLVFRTGSAYGDLILNQNGGNLGIGTASPAYPLDVVGRSRVQGAGGVGGGLWMTDSGSPTADAAFVGRSFDTDAWTGFYSALNGWNLVVTDLSYVGVGTTSPDHALTVNGGVSATLIDVGESVYNAINAVNNSTYSTILATNKGAGGAGGAYNNSENQPALWAENDGDFYAILSQGRLLVYGEGDATGGFFQTSDARFKANVTTLTNALDAVLHLRGVSYDWKRDAFKERNFPAGRQVGFIAQEVEPVLPQVVHTDRDGYKAVNYSGVVPVLVEAMKQQQAQIQAQQKQIDALKAENAALKEKQSRMAALAAAVRDLQTRQAIRSSDH
jgi:hypothetical protein